MTGNWNVLTLTWKESELVGGTKLYQREAVTKRHGSGEIHIIADWNLFCSGVYQTTFSQADAGILASFQLADCVDKWFSTPKRVCLLKLQLKGKRLCFNQKSEPKTSHYDNFAIRLILLCRNSNQSESTMLTGDFNVYVGMDSVT